jgi:hypothetical protein
MWPHTTYVPNYDTTTPPRTLPGPQPGTETNVAERGSSWTETRLHTMIGLTGYRARDLMRIRRALHRLTEKVWLTHVATYHICTKLRHEGVACACAGHDYGDYVYMCAGPV